MSSDVVMKIGLCGKIPDRGDFLAQGLSAGFVDPWTEWQQAVMAVSREQLGSQWLDVYLTSPIWHFALSAGVCGKEAVLGSMLPSVDQVGRHFPFTLAKTLHCSPAQARLQSQWTAPLQDVALAVLEDEFDFDSWLQTLQSTEFAWPQSEVQAVTGTRSDSAAKAPWALLSDSQSSADSLLDHSYRQHFGRYCMWWTDGSEYIPPCTLVTSGLPLVSQYAAMLNGDWQNRNWLVSQVVMDSNKAQK